MELTIAKKNSEISEKSIKELVDSFYEKVLKSDDLAYIFENKIGNFVYDKYSVHYMCDEDSFSVTEITPKYSLLDKIENDN